MQLMVHFAVGMSMGLLLLTVIDLTPRMEFGLMIVSGFWGVVPDGHWILFEMGYVGAAAAWKAFHRSIWVNLFWFHRFLDRHETGQNTLEGSVALGVLLVSAVSYFLLNDWRA